MLMIRSIRLARLVVSMLVLAVLIFVGCQRVERAPATDDSGVQIALQPVPLEDAMVVVLTDAEGAPITDATVALEGNMNHAGMIPVLADAVADDADGSADGRYRLPFTFTMLGDWIITVTVTQADGSAFSRNLDVRANAENFEGDEILPMEEMPSGASSATDDHSHADHDADDHEGVTGPHAAVVHVHDAMARPAPLAGGTGAVYFFFHNGSDTPVTLVGADSPAAGAVEIHTTINDNGVMRMRQLTEGIELGPDESTYLEPGGMHLMLIDLVAPLAEGDTIEVTLHFDSADDFTIEVPVVNMDDLPEGGEHDH
jgi:copper(I)-binding protein